MWFKMAIYCFLSLMCNFAFAWGPIGHRIVGQIAQNYLNPKALKEVQKLLPDETLAQVSTWADDMRSNPQYAYAETWHYVEIPNGQTYESSSKNRRGDLLKTLKELENVLRSQLESKEKKAEALKFYVHFMGDLHQPLHVGRGSDRGGNLCFVYWLNKNVKTNLHEVWDSLIIESQHLSFTEYAGFLNKVPEEKQKAYVQGDYLDWANESIRLREKIYPPNSHKYCKSPSTHFIPLRKNQPLLGWDYRYEHTKSLEAQLQMAGIRLAHKLNSIWN